MSAAEGSGGFALPAWLRHSRRMAIIAVLLPILYTLAGTLLLPRVLLHYAGTYVSEQLHRKLTLGEISFNPFTLTLRVRDASLSEANGAPIASFAALRVNVELWSSLFHRAYAFKEIALESPQLSAILRADGKLNLAELVPPSSTPAPPAGQAELISIRIGHLAVTQGRATIEDDTRPKPFTAALAPIGFALEDFRTTAGYQNAYQFSGTTLAGEKLVWSGKFTVQPLGSNGHFSVGDLKATTIAGWLQDDLPFQLPSGSLDVSGDYHLALGGALGLVLELPTLEFRDIGIAPRDAAAGAAPWVTVPQLSLASTRLSLGDHSLQVEKVSVRGASVIAQREADGSINLLRLLPPAAPSGATAVSPPLTTTATSTVTPTPAATPAASGAGADWHFGVNSIELAETRVDFTDQTAHPAVHVLLAPASMTVQGYSNAADAPPLRVLAKIGIGKGSVGSEGTLQLEPLTVDVKLNVLQLDLTALQPFVAQYTSLLLGSALLSSQLRLQYADRAGNSASKDSAGKGTPPQLRLRGDVQVARLAVSDAALKQELVSWQQLNARGIDWQVAPDRWSIEQLRLQKPYARVAIAADGSMNVTRALLPPGQAGVQQPAVDADEAEDADGADKMAEPATPAAAAPVAAATKAVAPKAAAAEAVGTKAKVVPITVTPARIREILIDNGSANFSDASLTPNFATGIYNLKGRIAGLNSDPASRAEVQLTGSVDRYAPVSISGQLNLLSATAFTDITLKFSNMELTTFNPYSGKFAGYNIERGKLTTELRYKIVDRQLDAQHHVILDQLEFGAKTESKSAVPLPIKLAVALLKDRNGVIDIELPVTGSLDNPKFRVMPLVWKALRGLLRKIVTAPFALLGKLFGGGPELSNVDFAPGSSQLAADQQNKLEQLAKALTERPQLKLDIPLGTVDARDDAALSAAAFSAALAPLLPAGATAELPPAAELSALTTLYTRSTGAAPVWPPELAAPVKGKAPLAPELVAARRDWLRQQLAPRFAAGTNEREQLGRARAEAVRAVLVDQGKIEPERIFLNARAPEGKAPETAVRMELKLQ
jgi:hypothetical protein